MNRFYKYLKSFDRFILKHSKVLGLVFSILALTSFAFAIFKVDYTTINVHLDHSFDIWTGILVCFVLNQFLDGFIWYYILKTFSIEISLFQSIKMNWKSHFYAVVTPNRIGEIPARRMLMEKENDVNTYKSASLHYLSKPMAFVLMLGITSFILFVNIDVYILIPACVITLAIFFVLLNKLRFYLKTIILNILRVSAFCVQHVFILKLLNFESVGFSNIAFIHSSGALIPHVFGFEMFVKAFIFESVSEYSNGLVLFSLSLFILWIMNIVLPSLLSLTYKLKPN